MGGLFFSPPDLRPHHNRLSCFYTFIFMKGYTLIDLFKKNNNPMINQYVIYN